MRVGAGEIQAWRPAFLLLLPLAALLLFYQPTLGHLAEMWDPRINGPYSHGFLALAVSIWLIYERRHGLAPLSVRPNPWALILLAAASITWLCATTINVRTLEIAAVAGMIPLLVLAILGVDFLKALLFPLAYLLVAIPVWDFLNAPLQDLAAVASFTALRAAQIPALLEGYFISVPSGRFLVSEGCSGFRYLLTSCAIGLLYAHVLTLKGWRYAAFILFSLAAALVANVIRICLVVAAGHLTDMQHPWVTVDHTVLGWFVFAVTLIPVMWFGSKMEPAAVADEPLEPVRPRRRSDAGPASMALVIVVATLLVSASPAATFQLRADSSWHEGIVFDPPGGHSRWSGPGEADGTWRPVYRGADRESAVTYGRRPRTVDLYVATYLVQEQGKELIHDYNAVYDPAQWQVEARHSRALEQRREVFEVNEVLLRHRTGKRRLVLYWYRVAGHDTASPWKAKLLEVVKLFSTQRASSVIAVASGYDNDPAAARELLGAFVVDMRRVVAERIDTSSGSVQVADSGR